MNAKTMTNVLLVLILFALVALLFAKSPISEVGAETLRLDQCITSDPYSKPDSYLHVVTHDVSPIQSDSQLK